MAFKCCGDLRSSEILVTQASPSQHQSASAPAQLPVVFVLCSCISEQWWGHKHRADRGQRAAETSSASWRKASAGLSPCSQLDLEEEDQVFFLWKKTPRILGFLNILPELYSLLWIIFKSNVLKAGPGSSSCCQGDLPPSVLLLRHCGTWHPFHVKQLKGDTWGCCGMLRDKCLPLAVYYILIVQ